MSDKPKDTAAAQVGETSNYWKECYKSVQPKLDEIEAETIERCAQWIVDQWGSAYQGVADEMRRKLKDAP